MPRAKTEPIANDEGLVASKLPVAPFVWFFQTKRAQFDEGDDVTATIDIAGQWSKLSFEDRVEYEELASRAKRIWSESFLHSEVNGLLKSNA